MLHGDLRWQNLYGLFLTLCVDILANSQCVYTNTEIWRFANFKSLKFARPDKVVMEDYNWFQTPS